MSVFRVDLRTGRAREFTPRGVNADTIAVAIAAMAAFCGAAPGRVSSPPPAEVDLSLIPSSVRLGPALATGRQSSGNAMEALLPRRTR